MALNSFFFQKNLQKIAPRPPSVLRLRYTTFLNPSLKLNICTFQLLLKALSYCKILLNWQPATISVLPSYDIFVPQKVPFLKIFDDVIACDLWFGSPNQSKILATPINWRLPAKIFEDLFFLENTCGCVLGPWPWPRAFLSLASRGSVLEKAVLGLGFFLCPWPWPRALCPRLHLWCTPNSNIIAQAVDDAVRNLGINRSFFCLLLSDAANYMIAAS